jgi:N-methylhydantoinase A
MSLGWCVGVDIGGTFTDIVAIELESADTRYLKVPSSREDPASAVLNGLAALHEEEGIAPAEVRLVLHGTTLATNAIIERRMAPTAVVATRGFGDILEIGRTWRSELYNPFYLPPAPLVPRDLRFEVEERVDARGRTLKPLERSEVEGLAERLTAAGVESVAVVLLHSYAEPAHEQLLARELAAAGDWYVSASSSLMREAREYERTATTTLNAALMPLIDRYLKDLARGLTEVGVDAGLLISQSNGGMQTPQLASERPVTLALSGPVAGVVALDRLAATLSMPNLIGLDVGGTSADISLITDYAPRVTTELSVGDLPVRLPSVKVDAIGAGGGSIAHLDGEALRVGPRSAGSSPGPACYGKGGTEPTVTDAHVALGRLPVGNKLAGRLQMQPERAEAALAQVAGPLGLTTKEAAAGVLSVVNSGMEGAIRVALRHRGDDPRDFGLVAFGGAGALHACELARSLGIRTVIVPPRPGTLCALGLLSADIRVDVARSEMHRVGEPGLAAVLEKIFAELEEEVRETVTDVDVSGEIVTERWCDMRYPGQAYEVLVPCPDEQVDEDTVRKLADEFHRRHHQAYAFSVPEDECEIVTVRLTARRSVGVPTPVVSLPEELTVHAVDHESHEFGLGDVKAKIYDRDALPVGYRVEGPAVVVQRDTTTWLPSYATATVHPSGSLVVDIEPEQYGIERPMRDE